MAESEVPDAVSAVSAVSAVLDESTTAPAAPVEVGAPEEGQAAAHIESSDEYDPALDVQDLAAESAASAASATAVPDPVSPSRDVPVVDAVPAGTPSVAVHEQPATAADASPAIPNDAPSAEIRVEAQPDPIESLPPSHQPSRSPTVASPSAPFTTIDPAGSRPQSSTQTLAATRARLPHDTIGLLEDRIKEDPKGDIDAWTTLVEEYKRRNKIDDVRTVYERFFKVFPQAADQWVALAHFENEANQRPRVEAIFNKTLQTLASLPMWNTYLDHIRRYYNIAVDKSGTASQTNHAAYEAVLDAVGIDKDSGNLWQDYIQFIKAGPGVVGQSDWQGQQKMDLLRKAYQRAVAVPMQAVEAIWREYSTFEMGLNKITGRRFLQEKSPDYMSARSSYTELQNITRDLKRNTIPNLPPIAGFAGDAEYMQQVELWIRWIQWEKKDPLVLKDENPAAYQARVLYAYKQALMALYFWPETWLDAADWCFAQGLETEGVNFLDQGAAANPESALLAFKRADRLELTTSNGNDERSKVQRGNTVREPYVKLLDALYELVGKALDREKRDLARIEAETAVPDATETNGVNGDDEDEADNHVAREREARRSAQIQAVKAVSGVQMTVLNRSISHAWIALMRAMQRMQGKGKVQRIPDSGIMDHVGGSRQAFTDARKRGRITSDVWVAAALLEFHNSDTEAAKRIFERGLKLFPEDEQFSLEYMQFLTNAGDHTNARVVFETTVTRLLQKPETITKAKPLFNFFHQYEACYGELTQTIKLETRMKEAFPDDPKLWSFASRYTHDSFDPTAVRPLVSPATQMKPRLLPTIEGPDAAQIISPSMAAALPVPAAIPNAANLILSPKRPFPQDDFESAGDAAQPRTKVARGESPLAGAAGRRLNQIKQTRRPGEGPVPNSGSAPAIPYTQQQPPTMPPPPPAPLPREVTFLLSIIPPASQYTALRFKPAEMVRILREVNLPSTVANLPNTNTGPAIPIAGYGAGSTPYSGSWT